ncbi:hypothetical protein ACPW96_14970 [Micromonospora sp. DT81.3]|uniref:hypothetical protein n=1 Tax=Micromonospora sp. DT81.3 TaxID=3416523 RepID=UPI003CEC072F
MARGRRDAKRQATQAREESDRQRALEDRRAAEARAARERQLIKRWGSAHGALNRLGSLSKELDRLHRQEANLLAERDELVNVLRANGQTWSALSSRTNLSRQALMKRIDQASTDGDVAPASGSSQG